MQFRTAATSAAATATSAVKKGATAATKEQQLEAEQQHVGMSIILY